MQTREIACFRRGASWVAVSCILVLFCLAAQAAEPTAAPAGRRTLHSIAGVYALSKEEARLGYPVDIEAVVNYCDPGWQMLFIQDGRGSTYLATHGNKTNYAPGTRVRVTGVTQVSYYAVVIGNPKIQFLSVGPEIKPVQRTVLELDAGASDSQMAITEGVLHPCLQTTDKPCLRIVEGTKEVTLLLRDHRSADLDRLVGATVKARGVASARLENGKRTGWEMFLESVKQIDVEMAPLADSSAPVSVQSLHPEDADLTMVRQVHLRGRVNWVSPNLFTLQDETGTIFVSTLAPVLARVGDPVDVIGFPFRGRFGMELRDSSARLATDHAVAVKIAPLNTTVEEIQKNSFNGKRVHLKAKLESQEGDSSQIVYHLSDQGHRFTAVLLLSENSRKIDAFAKGSTLELVGVEVLQSRGKSAPTQVLVLAESAGDIMMVPADNWLTWRRGLVILGFTAICLLVPLAWVKQLQRTVHKQMAINREHMEKELRLATKYQRLFERNLAAVYSLRPDGAITECNAAFLKLLGLEDRTQLDGRSYWEFETESDRREQMKNAQQTDMLSNCQATLRRDDGSIIYLLKNVSPVETPEGIVYETTAIDVTQMRRRQVELQRSRDTAVKNSLIDSLTELPNRRMLMESLPAIIENAKQAGTLVALLFIDLDGFKPVNDSLGHAAGDDVLVYVANALRSLVRKVDSLARIGGDEFMLILSDLGASEGAVRVAGDLLYAIDQPISLLGQEVHVSASIGISIFPTDACDVDELIVRADMAMYAAKRQGGNRFMFYSDTIAQAAGVEQKVAIQP